MSESIERKYYDMVRGPQSHPGAFANILVNPNEQIIEEK